MDIIYDEKSGAWKKKEEPYAELEVKTEADWEILQNAVSLRKELRDVGLYPGGEVFAWVGKVEEIMKKYIDFEE